MESTKQCCQCKQDLPATSEFFASRSDRKTVQFQSSCRACQKEYRKAHYESNRVKYIDKARIVKLKDREWLREYKKTLQCAVCGESRYWVLDFHHTDPSVKDKEVAYFFRAGQRKKALAEIEKCIVLCANCHRDLHYQELRKANNA